MWTENEDHAIVRLRRDGKTWNDIAAHFECRRKQVYERYRNYSIYSGQPKKRWTKNEDHAILRFRRDGKTWSDIAAHFECRRKQVYERYRNYSSYTGQQKKEWTSRDIGLLMAMASKNNRSWVELGRFFGCSPNVAKNTFNMRIRRPKTKTKCGPWKRAPLVLPRGACYRCGRRHRE